MRNKNEEKHFTKISPWLYGLSIILTGALFMLPKELFENSGKNISDCHVLEGRIVQYAQYFVYPKLPNKRIAPFMKQYVLSYKYEQNYREG